MKECKGKLYKINGKTYCIGEKKSKKSKKKINKSNRNKKKIRVTLKN